MLQEEHLENRNMKGTSPAMPFVTAQQECSSPALKEAWERGETKGNSKVRWAKPREEVIRLLKALRDMAWGPQEEVKVECFPQSS